MNNILWALQIILSIKLVSVAYTHGLRQDKTSLQEAIQKWDAVARPMLTLVAICSLLGAAGLIIPAALGVMSWLTPWTAAIRKHKRSWLVWLTIMPGLFVIFLLLGELLAPH